MNAAQGSRDGRGAGAGATGTQRGREVMGGWPSA